MMKLNFFNIFGKFLKLTFKLGIFKYFFYGNFRTYNIIFEKLGDFFGGLILTENATTEAIANGYGSSNRRCRPNSQGWYTVAALRE